LEQFFHGYIKEIVMMNEFLAEMYNTRENIGAQGSADDIEKMAEAQILGNDLAAEGYDISQLPYETLVKVAYELWGENSAIVKEAQENMEEEGEKEEEEGEKEEEGEEKEGSFEEKVAEADFLGRVMAHSFTDEKNSIEKQARGIPFRKQVVEGTRGFMRSMRGKGPRTGAPLGPREGTSLEKLRAAVGYKAKPAVEKAKELAEKAKPAVEHVKRHRGKYMAGGAGAAAATTGAVGYGAGKKKAASALDALAEQRAMEMLKEAGYEFDNAPSEEEVLKEAVDQRALEMLAEAGYLEE
jgi:hypothetical protein